MSKEDFYFINNARESFKFFIDYDGWIRLNVSLKSDLLASFRLNKCESQKLSEWLNGWIDVNDKLPITYITGDWDGKKSDEVVVETKSGKKYLAVCYHGFMDGSEFTDWYCANEGYEILDEIVRWHKILD